MIFFDIDRTLLDHDSAERAAAIQFHAGHAASFPESPDEFVARWHMLAETHMRRYFDGLTTFAGQRRSRMRELFGREALSDSEADMLFDAYLSKYKANWSLFPDVLPCLDRLAGARLGIISNGNSLLQREKLQNTGIVDRFDVVVMSGDVGHAKPSQAIFHAACAGAGEAPENCVYIGDDFAVDAIGSRQAGMHGIWLNRVGGHNADEEPMVTSLAAISENGNCSRF